VLHVTHSLNHPLQQRWCWSGVIDSPMIWFQFEAMQHIKEDKEGGAATGEIK
jgi:hypothetical protein